MADITLLRAKTACAGAGLEADFFTSPTIRSVICSQHTFVIRSAVAIGLTRHTCGAAGCREASVGFAGFSRLAIAALVALHALAFGRTDACCAWVCGATSTASPAFAFFACFAVAVGKANSDTTLVFAFAAVVLTDGLERIFAETFGVRHTRHTAALLGVTHGIFRIFAIRVGKATDAQLQAGVALLYAVAIRIPCASFGTRAVFAAITRWALPVVAATHVATGFFARTNPATCPASTRIFARLSVGPQRTAGL